MLRSIVASGIRFAPLSVFSALWASWLFVLVFWYQGVYYLWFLRLGPWT